MKYYVKTRLIGRLQALIGRQALIGQIIGRSGLEGEENEEEVIDEDETTTIQFESMESINENQSKNQTATSAKQSSSDRQEFQYFGWGTRSYNNHKSGTGIVLN